MKKEGLELLQGEIMTSVSFTAFMTAVTIFFTGILLTNFKDYDNSVKIPILLLIISTFGFLYSTLIFANTSGNISRLGGRNIHKQILIGDVLSEYFGVYFLVISVPLVINVITTDNFLRISTLIISFLGLSIYHLSGFSIMQRHFLRLHYLFFSIIILLAVSLWLAQVFNPRYLVNLTIIFILFISALAFFVEKER